MKIKKSAIIIEDETPSIEQMKRFLSKRSEIRLLDIAKNGETALRKITRNKYDLVFLDLNLPRISGIELMRSFNKQTYFIVITSRKDKAIDSLNLGAVDYLLKPIYEDRFNQAIDKYLAFSSSMEMKNKSKLLSIVQDKKKYFIESSSIVYIESNQGYSIIHTEEATYKSRTSLVSIYAELSAFGLLQIHKKFLVNRKYIHKIEQTDNKRNYIIKLNDNEDTELPLGKINLKE